MATVRIHSETSQLKRRTLTQYQAQPLPHNPHGVDAPWVEHFQSLTYEKKEQGTTLREAQREQRAREGGVEGPFPDDRGGRRRGRGRRQHFQLCLSSVEHDRRIRGRLRGEVLQVVVEVPQEVPPRRVE